MATRIPVVTKTIGTGQDGLAECPTADAIDIAFGGTGGKTEAQALSNLGAVSTTAFDSHQNNVNNPHAVTPAQIGAVPDSSVGIANGVAGLDGGGKIPVGQIPAVAIPSMHVVADSTARLALTVQEGDEAKQIDDSSHWVYDGTTWHMYPEGGGGGSSIFGSEFQLEESLGVSTTTSSGYQNKMTMVTSNLPVGKYRLGVSYGWNYDNTTLDFEAKIILDGSDLLEPHKQEPQDAGSSWGSTGTSQRYYLTRVFYLDLSGVHTFDLEWRTNSSGEEASIWDAVIELWRVS